MALVIRSLATVLTLRFLMRRRNNLVLNYGASSLMLSLDWSHLLMPSNLKLDLKVASLLLIGVLYSAVLNMQHSTIYFNQLEQSSQSAGW